MKYLRPCAALAVVGAAVLLSGCVVAPIGPGPVAVYPQYPVYVDPAPVVVVPAYRYYSPHRGYRGYRHWR